MEYKKFLELSYDELERKKKDIENEITKINKIIGKRKKVIKEMNILFLQIEKEVLENKQKLKYDEMLNYLNNNILKNPIFGKDKFCSNIVYKFDDNIDICKIHWDLVDLTNKINKIDNDIKFINFGYCKPFISPVRNTINK
jgi:hypothetical protein